MEKTSLLPRRGWRSWDGRPANGCGVFNTDWLDPGLEVRRRDSEKVDTTQVDKRVSHGLGGRKKGRPGCLNNREGGKREPDNLGWGSKKVVMGIPDGDWYTKPRRQKSNEIQQRFGGCGAHVGY